MILDLVSAMALVLLGWLLAGAALVGLGLWVRRLCRLGAEAEGFVYDSFWLGLALAIAALQVYHLARPVDDLAAIGLLVVGGLGCAVHAGPLGRAVKRGLGCPWFMLAAGGGTLWLANRALAACDASDSGLYHMIGMRWMIEHPIIPGLANLCGPLGFNNSIWLYDAALDAGPWTLRCTHLATPLLLLATYLRSCRAAAAWFTETGPMRALRPFQASLAVVVIDSAVSPHGASISTDLPAVLMLFAALDALLRLLAAPASLGQKAFLTITAGTVAAAALTVKISAVALSAGIWGLAVVGFWLSVKDNARIDRYDRVGAPGPWRLGLLHAGLPTVLIGVWLVRGVVQSGYPLFPATLLPMPVDWRVPLEPTAALRDWVIQFARLPDIQPPELYVGGFRWIVPWLKSLPAQGPVKSVFPVALAVLWALWLLKPGRGGSEASGAREVRTRLWLVVALLMGATVFWFFTAPAPRFGFVTFWGLAGVLAAMVVLGWKSRPRPAVLALVLVLQVGSVVPALLIRAWVVNDLRHRGPAALTEMLFVKPGPDGGFHPYPAADLSLFTTTSGFAYWAPHESDRVWYGPLPSSPYRDAGVRERVPGDLRKGFTRDATPFEPLNWPHYGSTFLEMWRASDRLPRADAPATEGTGGLPG